MSDHLPHHLVVKLRVSGGFLAGTELHFVDGLNCLIGGRGAGKTTALELLRFGLGLMPDPRNHPQRHKYIDGLVKSNLASGKVTISLRTKSGMGYTAERRGNETVQVLDERGQAVPVSLDNDLIFSADVFSQNEIEEIASDPAAQLELLDRFAAAETLEIERELDSLGRQLDQSAQALTRLDDEIEDLAAKASELPALDERLRGLAEVSGPDAEKVNKGHAERVVRQREAQIPQLLRTAVDKVTTDLRRMLATYRATQDAHLVTALETGLNGEVFRSIATDLAAFTAILEAATVSVDEAAARVGTALNVHASQLAHQHAEQEAAYRALVSASEDLGGRSAERAKLQDALALAQNHANALGTKRHERAALLCARRDLLNRISEQRDKRFSLRKLVAARITVQLPAIRVTVTQGEDVQQYREFLAESLKGSGLKQGMMADRLVQQLLPTELAEIVATDDLAAFTAKTGLDSDRARRALSALRTGGLVYQIEALDLHDRPCIELLDGDRYKQSPHLSTGQRCTTILPILLLQSERPLLVDQPEDNLDNAFVYETVVKALHQVKGSRQVIFVTHNPNIPVLGQAERVFVFSSDGRQGSAVQAGTVDECKDQIERILEGGSEAFRQRKQRYGY
ncbi:MAG: AAA family ATPase [Deltaproteobacteria bacterium]|nr:AAA family ATPase [Deltaproteobacteria bacterium]